MTREHVRSSTGTEKKQSEERTRSISRDEDEQRHKSRKINPALPQREQSTRSADTQTSGYDKDLDDVRRSGPYKRFEERGGPPGTRDNSEQDRFVTNHSDNSVDRHGNRKRFAPQSDQERHEQYQQGSRLPSDTRPAFQGGGKKHSGRL